MLLNRANHLFVTTTLILILSLNSISWSLTNNIPNKLPNKAPSNSPNYCSNYRPLSSIDRQLISDLRFKMESINPSLEGSKLNAKLSEIQKSKSIIGIKENHPDHFQGLVAELYLRQQLHKTIGLNNLPYKEFKIFADLILYHKAMDNRGFINETQFFIARQKLEKTVINYFETKQYPTIQFIKKQLETLTSDLLHNKKINSPIKKVAHEFLQLESHKSQILGLIEIMSRQLLDRNRLNREEVLSQNAMIDLSVNVATAIAGFSAVVASGITLGGLSSFLSSSSRTMTTVALTTSAACGVGLVTRYSFEQINKSYLDISKALYRSIQNNTKLACELGYQNSDNQSYSKLLSPVSIPDEAKPATAKDYMITCGFSAAAAISPGVIGVGVDALIAGLFVNASYNLVKESYIVLTEVPRLLELQGQALAFNGSQDKYHELNAKIKDSEAKVALYLLAMGNTAINSFRFGLLLGMDRKNITDALGKAKNLIKANKTTKSTDLQMLKLITEKSKID